MIFRLPALVESQSKDTEATKRPARDKSYQYPTFASLCLLDYQLQTLASIFDVAFSDNKVV